MEHATGQVSQGDGRDDCAAEVVAFLRDRSVPCPRCGYDLRDTKAAQCAECGEPLVLKIGSPRPRFGWLVVAMVPGSFSGVMAVFVLIPIVMTILEGARAGQGVPWPIFVADAFGFLSVSSVVVMYRYRHRIMLWKTRRQIAFAAAVWGIHVLMLVMLFLASVFLV